MQDVIDLFAAGLTTRQILAEIPDIGFSNAIRQPAGLSSGYPTDA